MRIKVNYTNGKSMFCWTNMTLEEIAKYFFSQSEVNSIDFPDGVSEDTPLYTKTITELYRVPTTEEKQSQLMYNIHAAYKLHFKQDKQEFQIPDHESSYKLMDVECSEKYDSVTTFKLYKLYAGMTGEYEILQTNAPKEQVIKYSIACAEGTLPEDDPILFFTQKGYQVAFLGCQYDDEEVHVDCEIDGYDYIK